MGIDSIRGPRSVDPHAASAERTGAPAGAPSAEFRVGAARAENDAVEPVAPSPLELVRSGRIDVARYLDLKVEEATAHLRALPPAQLESIRSTLRDRLATDPALADLVQVAARTASAASRRPDDE